MSHRKQNRREKGISLVVGTASMIFLIPLIGLFIDLGILYSVKARLQAAVDSAALAAARSLTDGQTTQAQQSNAEQTAQNWFYANFPTGNWSTTNTTILTDSVADDANNPHLQDVTFTAQTTVPTWFMRFQNFLSTTIQATGTASRRDLVAMLVLDRSGSMCSVNGAIPNGMPPCSKANTTTACASMINDAKTFTGLFAEGRDMIGMVTFSDGSYIDSSPTTTFQTTLGYYSDSSNNGNGAIDTIVCQGGTGTAGAMSIAYNELYKMALPGALNVIMLETDGLPNTLAYNFWDGSTAGISHTSNCQDASGKTYAGGGWRTAASMPSWTPGYTMGPNGYMSDIPAGAIGGFYEADPYQGPPYFTWTLYNPWQTGDSSNNNSIDASGNGCSWSGGLSYNTYQNDFAWLPAQDIYGNTVTHANQYMSLTLTGGHNVLTGNIATDWPNMHAAALNATEYSAYQARSNATLPAYVFVIGLGGNIGTQPDTNLLQRMANDPNTGKFNTPDPCAQTGANCYTYTNQPEGTMIYAPSTADLGAAFQTIASQILRLSH